MRQLSKMFMLTVLFYVKYLIRACYNRRTVTHLPTKPVKLAMIRFLITLTIWFNHHRTRHQQLLRQLRCPDNRSGSAGVIVWELNLVFVTGDEQNLAGVFTQLLDQHYNNCLA